MSASAEKKGFVRLTTATPLARQPPAARNQTAQTRTFPTALAPLLVGRDRGVEALGIRDRHALDRVGEEHVLRVEEVAALVLGDLELVAEGDRVEGAGELAVAAEDAAAHVDLVDPRVALSRRNAVLGGVLLRDDADAVRRAGGGAERAA